MASVHGSVFAPLSASDAGADLWAKVHNALVDLSLLYAECGFPSLADEVTQTLIRFDTVYIDPFLEMSSRPSDGPAVQETSNPPATK